VDQKIFLIIFLSFTAGYILRTIISSYQAFQEMGSFVEARADECLMLIGECVYKISFVDELCIKMLEDVSPQDAKILRNTLGENFEDWKRATIQSFLEQYPESYKWHLNYKDWDGVMERLSDIYTKEKISSDKKSR
jgi:hypothetical protein